jgi:hypothetical protein
MFCPNCGICPKCGNFMDMCGVGGAFTEQMIFYNCPYCHNMVYGNLTKKEIINKIRDIDNQVEEYEKEQKLKDERKWWEFWK